MTFTAPSLSIRCATTPLATTMTVRGEVDLATAPQLRDQILRHLNDRPELHLGLDGVTFMDSAGLHVLLASRRRASLLGSRLVLVSTSRAVRRLLELTGTAGLFAHQTETTHSVDAVADPV